MVSYTRVHLTPTLFPPLWLPKKVKFHTLLFTRFWLKRVIRLRFRLLSLTVLMPISHTNCDKNRELYPPFKALKIG